IDTSYCTIRNVGDFTAKHTLTMPNLEPVTTYFFRVAASDKSGNQNFSGNYSFTTTSSISVDDIETVPRSERQLVEKVASLISEVKSTAGLIAIENVVQEQAESTVVPPKILGKPDLEIGTDSVTIRWTTDKESDSVVYIAREGEYNPNAENPYARKEGDADASTQEHSVTVYGLSPSTGYHYKVSSKSALGMAGESVDYTFQTRSLVPQIFTVRMQKVEERSATVNWSTSFPASGIVEYTNMSTHKTLSIGDPNFLVTHSLQLTNLTFQTRYSIIIRAKNQAGDETVSNPIYFFTIKDAEPPIISQVSNESTLYPGEDVKVQSIIAWSTDEPAVCHLSYVKGVVKSDKENVNLEPETGLLTNHVKVMTEFLPETVYKFWVTCLDSNNNSASSEDFVLLTPTKEKSIIDIIIGNFKSTFGWLDTIGGKK
ncbi:MAG: fibronectin type III domain-containing protein, partial [bacterium]|nr:fibronectin type III domain-containing protein [bacterium]